MVYGYARVSTFGQGAYGNSLEGQRQQLIAAGADEIVYDTYTGTKMDRPNFTNLINQLQEGDKLIVCKLDRFARTLVEGVQTIQQLMNRGVAVQVLNMGTVENTPTGKLILAVMLSFAEFERDMIVERTQNGKAIARSKGIKVDGRPKKYSTTKMKHAMDLLDEGNSYTHVAEMTGISKSTLIRARRKERMD